MNSSFPFAFVVHPIQPKDLARLSEKVRFVRYLPDPWIEHLLVRIKPRLVSHITGVQSICGPTTEGWFVGCPLTPRQMVKDLPIEEVYRRIVRCCEIAAEKGAKVIGLGAFTSVVGDGGITVAQRSPIAVTTGNSYTVATAIEGTLLACRRLEMDLGGAELAVVGATGSIGKTCARVLARHFGSMTLVGRDEARTAAVAEQIPGAQATTDIERIRHADAVVTVTSSDSAIILPEHLKPGAVVCDVSRPRDVSVRVAKERLDVLVIEGGVVSVPGNVEFNFNFGFPAKTAYACMSETMLLALEGRAESFTLGKEVSVEQVDEMSHLAEKHGFQLAGFRSFEREVSEATIDRVRRARLIGSTVPRSKATL